MTPKETLYAALTALRETNSADIQALFPYASTEQQGFIGHLLERRYMVATSPMWVRGTCHALTMWSPSPKEPLRIVHTHALACAEAKRAWVYHFVQEAAAHAHNTWGGSLHQRTWRSAVQVRIVDPTRPAEKPVRTLCIPLGDTLDVDEAFAQPLPPAATADPLYGMEVIGNVPFYPMHVCALCGTALKVDCCPQCEIPYEHTPEFVGFRSLSLTPEMIALIEKSGHTFPNRPSRKPAVA